MHKSIALGALIASASITTLAANTYYSTADSVYAASGSAWNLAADGSGKAGMSKTYTLPANDLIIQEGHKIRTSGRKQDLTWTPQSITLNGEFQSIYPNNSTFNTDIKVGPNAAWKIGNEVSTVNGSGKLLLGKNKLIMQHVSSGSKGALNFGLNIVSDGGSIKLNYLSDALQYIYFSNLTPEFQGTIDGNNANDCIIRFAKGNGSSGARVIIGREGNEKKVKLDLNTKFAVARLKIDSQEIPKGAYTYKDLIAINKDFADNLINNRGKVYVGQKVK